MQVDSSPAASFLPSKRQRAGLSLALPMCFSIHFTITLQDACTFNSLYSLCVYIVEGDGLHSLSQLGVECCICVGLSHESLK